MSEHGPSIAAEVADLRFAVAPVRTCAGKVMSDRIEIPHSVVL